MFDAVREMEKMTSRRPLLLRFKWACAAIAATLGFCLTCVLLLAGAVHALDPNKRITQYVHTVLANTGWLRAGRHVCPLAQTSDGFLWFSCSAGLYRFDGVRFLQRGVPGARHDSRSNQCIRQILMSTATMQVGSGY